MTQMLKVHRVSSTSCVDWLL